MTTPENQPEPGRDANPNPGYGSPTGPPTPAAGPPAQNGPAPGQRPEPQYGQYASGPYSYQAAQPSGYAYAGGKPAKGPAPREVVWGSWLILAGGILGFINNVITSFSLPSVLTPEEQQAISDGGMDGQSVTSFLVSFGIVVALIGLGFYVLVAVFARKGKNWARILGTFFAAVSLIGLITMAGTYFSSPLGLLSLVSSLLGIAGIVLLYLKPSNPYFRTAPWYPY